MTETGLRESKRRAMGLALARAAFALALERGLDGFTIEEVAHRVGVSRRTFANYYSCKEEAVVAVAIEQLHAGIETMPDLPESTPLLSWVKALARHQLSRGMLTLLGQLRQLASTYPQLEPYLSEVHTQIRRLAQTAVSARAGSHVSKLTVHIVVGAVYGALMAVLDGDSASPGSGSPISAALGSMPTSDSSPDRPPEEPHIDQFLGTVFDQLEAGL